MGIAIEVVRTTTTTVVNNIRARSFGVPLILSGSIPFAGGRRYACSGAGLAQMVLDGIATTDSAYRIVQRMVNQSPTCREVIVYSRLSNHIQDLDLTPVNTTTGFVYDFEVWGTAPSPTRITFTTPGAATPTTIAAALAPLIDAVVGVNAVAAASTVSVTPALAGDIVYVNGAADTALTVKESGADNGVATSLAAALVDFGDQFYGVVLDSLAASEQALAATFCQNNDKVFIALTADSDVRTAVTTDIASVLQTAGRRNTAVIPTRYPGDRADAALMAQLFAANPGSVSAAGKVLTGVRFDTWTAGQEAFLEAKSTLPYKSIVTGIGQTVIGKASDGFPFAAVRDLSFLVQRIKEAYAAFTQQNSKIPFTDSGVLAATSPLRTTLDLGVKLGILASYTVNDLKASDYTESQRQAGVLTGLQATVVLAGEIIAVDISLTVRF